jgi:citrate/tricarballylate utilization protein
MRRPVTIKPSRDALTSLEELIGEATRQLTVCNACRYCEGLCAVYPALERRMLLQAADVSQLANLCHDCRACFDACMYVPPHEFGLNLPKILASTRLADYRRYVWPANPPRLLRGWAGVFAVTASTTVMVFVLAVVRVGFGGLVRGHETAASPYTLLPYPLLLVLVTVPALFAVVVMAAACWRFWHGTGTPGDPPLRFKAMMRALRDAFTVRNLGGGGGKCYYPEPDRPSSERRLLHAAVMYGFGLCLVSTVAAAILQDILGIEPPYPVISVPVMAGLVGGIGLVIGSAGLLYLKAQAADVTSVGEMTIKDYGLLSALTFLGVSGLATLLVRDTPAFDLVFIVHMGAVMSTFACAPYSKFVHIQYRVLALFRDRLEQAGQRGSNNSAIKSRGTPKAGLAE